MWQQAYVASLLIVLSGVFTQSVRGQLSLDVIAITGNVSPDGNGTFSRFGLPVINNAGRIAFRISLIDSSDGQNDDRGLFLGGGSGGLRPVIREGDRIPDGDGRFDGFGNIALNHTDQIAFFAPIIDANTRVRVASGIFRVDSNASVVELAREGQVVPDGNGHYSGLSNVFGLSDAGQVAFYSRLANTTGGDNDDVGVFRSGGTAGTIQLARKGQLAPDGDGRFSDLHAPIINSLGQVAFFGEIPLEDGLFLANSTGDLTQLVRERQMAPDGQGDFRRFDFTTLNDVGQVAFRGSLAPNGFDHDGGIFRVDGLDGPVQLARTGQGVPNVDDTFSSFSVPVMNNSGQTAFIASFESGDGGLFRTNDTGLDLLVAAGQTVPDGNGEFQYMSEFALNDVGQIAFASSLTGTRQPGNDDWGLYFFDDSEGLRQVVRIGDSLLGSTVTDFEFRQGFFGVQNGLNDLGQVAFQFELDDGREGVAIATLIPEPRTRVFAALAIVVLSSRRKRFFGSLLNPKDESRNLHSPRPTIWLWWSELSVKR